MVARCLADSDPRDLHRGHDRENEAGDERDAHAVKTSTRTSSDTSSRRGNPLTGALSNTFSPSHARRTPNARAEHCQWQALGQHLTHDAAAARSKRHPQSDLVPPACAARQQQSRHVGAGDQQHERHGTLEHHQRRPVVSRRLTVDVEQPRARSLQRLDAQGRIPDGERDRFPRAGQRSASSSACACSIETPGLRRPTIVLPPTRLSTCARVRHSGAKNSRSSPKKSKSSGRTPMTVVGCSIQRHRLSQRSRGHLRSGAATMRWLRRTTGAT